MAAQLPKALTKLVAFRVLHVAAEIAGRHPVRFVADDQIPFRRSGQLLLEVFVARQHIEPGDQPVAVVEDVARTRGLDHVPRQDVKLQRELLAQLVLPLFDQTAGCDDQAAFQIAARD